MLVRCWLWKLQLCNLVYALLSVNAGHFIFILANLFVPTVNHPVSKTAQTATELLIFCVILILKELLWISNSQNNLFSSLVLTPTPSFNNVCAGLMHACTNDYNCVQMVIAVHTWIYVDLRFSIMSCNHAGFFPLLFSVLCAPLYTSSRSTIYDLLQAGD